MTLPSRFWFGPLLFLLLNSFKASSQTEGSLSGVVRDVGGSALSGITLALSKSPSDAVLLHATTDKVGEFHFDHLASGTYQFSTDQPGDTLTPDGPVTMPARTSALHVDLVLTHAKESVAQRPALQLQAAGIRGYIDPGGYSAPADAAAASKLIQGAAALNRADTSKEETATACGRGADLLKATLDHPDNASAQRQLGQYYLATHQSQKAFTVLKRARTLDTHNAETLVSFAEALLQNREFAVAHDLLSGDTAGANKAVVHRLLARSDEGLGAFRQASVEYQSAVELESAEADFYGAGYEMILAGSAETARKFFKLGTERYPASTTLLTGIGTADFLLGQTAEATRTFLRCVTLHPGDPRVYAFLSASFTVSGAEPDAVKASFRQYYELFPQSADAAYFYALSLAREGRSNMSSKPDEVEVLLRRAVQLDPRFAKAHLQLGSVYLDRGDYAQAAEELKNTLGLDPGLGDAHYKLSLAYRSAGQTALADQQMQLFLAGKTQNTLGSQTPDIQIERFLSVFAASSTTNHNIQCAN